MLTSLNLMARSLERPGLMVFPNFCAFYSPTVISVQDTVLAAASRRQLSMEDGKVEGSAAGGGAVSLVPTGSTHETFTDALVLFAGKTSWLLKMVIPMTSIFPVIRQKWPLTRTCCSYTISLNYTALKIIC